MTIYRSFLLLQSFIINLKNLFEELVVVPFKSFLDIHLETFSIYNNHVIKILIIAKLFF